NKKDSYVCLIDELVIMLTTTRPDGFPPPRFGSTSSELNRLIGFFNRFLNLIKNPGRYPSDGLRFQPYAFGSNWDRSLFSCKNRRPRPRRHSRRNDPS